MTDSFRCLLTDLGLLDLFDNEIAKEVFRNVDFPFLPREYYIPNVEEPHEPFDYAASIYALGELFYWMFLGKASTPITNRTAGIGYWKEKENHSAQPLRALFPQIPAALERVIQTAMAVDPKKRFDRPAAVVAALARATATLREEIAYNPDYGTKPIINYLVEIGLAPVSDQRSSIISFAKERLVVEPGGGDSTRITVFNESHDRADRFRLRVESQHEAIAEDWIMRSVEQGGLANYREDANFALTVSPPAGVFIPAGEYDLLVRVSSSNQNWRPVGEATIKVVVRRIAYGIVDSVWPQEMIDSTPAQLNVRNLGNFRESFRVDLRSDDNSLLFAPAQLTAVVDPGQSEAIPFSPKPRQRPWFGRAKKVKLTAQVAMQQSGKLELATAQVFVRSFFPPLMLAMTFLGLLLFSLFFLWLSRPSMEPYTVLVTQADQLRNVPQSKCNTLNLADCLLLDERAVRRPALIVAWKLQSPNQRFSSRYFGAVFSWIWGNPTSPQQKVLGNHVKTVGLQLFPQQESVIPITQTIGAKELNSGSNILTFTNVITEVTHMVYMYSNPSSLAMIDNPRLIARNRIGEMKWLGPLRWLGTRAYDIFYFQLASEPELEPTAIPPVKLARFCVATADTQSPESCATDTEHTEPLLYYAYQAENLRLRWAYDAFGRDVQLRLEPLAIDLDPTASETAIPAPIVPGLYTYTVRLSDQVNQQSDERQLVVNVQEILCRVIAQGGLPLYKSPGTDYEVVGNIPMNRYVVQRSDPADYTQNNDPLDWVRVVVRETAEDGWVDADIKGLECPNRQPLTTANSADTAAQTASGESEPANDQGVASNTPTPIFPVEKLEFSATNTPVPTPEPVPTATPQPLVVDIRIDKEFIEPNECIRIEWTITGVESVRYGKTAREDINTVSFEGKTANDDHLEVDCEITETTWLVWRIKIPTGAGLVETLEVRKITVE